jgi:hypothetical protein
VPCQLISKPFNRTVAFDPLTPAMKVPCATLPSGKLCFAATVVKGDGPFACAGCAAPVVLKRGHVKVAHFAHKSATTASCSEGMLHRATKEWIAELACRPDFCIQAVCGHCHDVHTVFRGHGACTAVVEVGMDSADQKRKYVVDCLIYDAGRPAVYVEVRDTHAAGSSKLRWLEGRSHHHTPAIEVAALDLVETGFPTVWGTVDRRTCGLCCTEVGAKRRAAKAAHRARHVRRCGVRWLSSTKAMLRARHKRMVTRWRMKTRMGPKFCTRQFEKEYTACAKCKHPLRRTEGRVHELKQWHRECYPGCKVCGEFTGNAQFCSCYKPRVPCVEYTCRECDVWIATDKYGGRCVHCNMERKGQRGYGYSGGYNNYN